MRRVDDQEGNKGMNEVKKRGQLRNRAEKEERRKRTKDRSGEKSVGTECRGIRRADRGK